MFIYVMFRVKTKSKHNEWEKMNTAEAPLNDLFHIQAILQFKRAHFVGD